MIRTPLLTVPATIACALVLASCGGAHKAGDDTIHVKESSGPPSDVLRFMPLEDGTVYAYDTANDLGDKGVLMMQVSRPRPSRIDLRVGSRTERLQLEDGGIAYVQGGYLLKAPLAADARWRSRSGTVRVASVEETAQVPAGTFQGCLKTVEESHEPGASKTVTSLYCPHVGLVSIDVVGDTDMGHGHETAVLRSFGPAVNLTGNDVTTTTE